MTLIRHSKRTSGGEPAIIYVLEFYKLYGVGKLFFVVVCNYVLLRCPPYSNTGPRLGGNSESWEVSQESLKVPKTTTRVDFKSLISLFKELPPLGGKSSHPSGGGGKSSGKNGAGDGGRSLVKTLLRDS